MPTALDDPAFLARLRAEAHATPARIAEATRMRAVKAAEERRRGEGGRGGSRRWNLNFEILTPPLAHSESRGGTVCGDIPSVRGGAVEGVGVDSSGAVCRADERDCAI